MHEIIHGQPNVERFHVRGFKEQGTTTPFDMVALNGISRYHLAMEAMWRAPRMQARWESLVALCEETLRNAVAYSVEHMEDRPDIRDWMWTED